MTKSKQGVRECFYAIHHLQENDELAIVHRVGASRANLNAAASSLCVFFLDLNSGFLFPLSMLLNGWKNDVDAAIELSVF